MFANALLIKAAYGWDSREDAASIVTYGRFEALLEISTVTTPTEAYAIADAQLATYAEVQREITATVVPVTDADKAYVGFAGPGADVLVPGDDGPPTSERVLSVAANEDDNGVATVVLSLRQTILTPEERVARLLKKVIPSGFSDVMQLSTSGQTVGGDRTSGSGSVVVAANGPFVVQLQVTDPSGSDLATGDGQAFFRVNEELNGRSLIAVAAHVTTVSTSGDPEVQVANVTDAVDMLSTPLTIDANEQDSSTATTPAVVDTANDAVATGDELRIDVDDAGTGTKGLIVELTFQ